MLRHFITIVIPAALPFLLFGIYVLLARYRARKAGQPNPPSWATAPWSSLVTAAALLVIASLIYVRFAFEGDLYTG